MCAVVTRRGLFAALAGLVAAKVVGVPGPREQRFEPAEFGLGFDTTTALEEDAEALRVAEWCAYEARGVPHEFRVSFKYAEPVEGSQREGLEF